MNKISNLQDISIDKIETDIMSVLYANLDIKFSQYTLFNKVLEDKYDGQYSSQIHSNFKTRFLLVLRNLMSKYDDIVITKNNNIYWIMCVSESGSISNQDFSDDISNSKSINLQHNVDKNITQQVSLNLVDFAQMHNYIYETNLTDFVNWLDPLDGNTIYHELVIYQNKYLIEKLLLEDKFNFMVLNSYGISPLEMSTNLDISKLLSAHLIQKMILLYEKTEMLKNNIETNSKNYELKIKYFESLEYKNKIINEINIIDIIIVKLNNFYEKYNLHIVSGLICVIAIKYLFLFVL